jgi:hypothetical protein
MIAEARADVRGAEAAMERRRSASFAHADPSWLNRIGAAMTNPAARMKVGHRR